MENHSPKVVEEYHAFSRARCQASFSQDAALGLFVSRVVGGYAILRPILMCCLQLAMGKMMEQGPVLIVTFQAQLVMVIKNLKGEVVEGDPVSGELREWRFGTTSHTESPYAYLPSIDPTQLGARRVLKLERKN